MDELVCPSCRGRQFTKISEHSYECRYCGALIKENIKDYQSPVPPASQTIIIQQPVEAPPDITPFPTEISYAATLREGMIPYLGKLTIYPDKFVFVPEMLSKGNLSPREWNVTDIIGFTKGAFYNLHIKVRNHNDVHLNMYGGKRIINELEARRRFWLEKK